MAYIVEAAWFKAEGAIVDWAAIAARLKMQWQGSEPRALHLRWMLHKDLGLPTEPFVVWRRPKYLAGAGMKVLAFTSQYAEYLFGDTVVTWPEGSMCRVVIKSNAAVSSFITAFAGSATYGSSMTMLSIGTGPQTTVIESTEIDGLIIQGSLNITEIKGLPQDWIAQEAGWQKWEIVGLPVVPPEWKNIGKYETTQQGMITALTDPGTAAMQRLARGGPKLGWQPSLPTFEAVPAWSAPTPALLLNEVRQDIVSRLRPMMQQAAPKDQINWKEEIIVPPLTNPNTGETIPDQGPQKAKNSPLAATLMGGSTDPWLALTLGFGTAYTMGGAAGTAAAVPSGPEMFDYMITGRWEKGFDGKSAPVDMAALVPTPGPAPAVAVPANLDPKMMGYVRPLVTDGDWRCSVKTAWDRPPDEEIARPRSYSFVRASKAPAEPTRVMIPKRVSNGYRYPMINSAQIIPLPDDWWQVSAVDREVAIPSATGVRKLRYGIAQQDIYGQWSPWAATYYEANQPGVDDVAMVSATLKPTAHADPADPVCDGELTIEFIWDWRRRRPERIEFRGYLYAAAKHGDPPPNPNVPGGLQRSLGGGGATLSVKFTLDTPSAPNDGAATFTSLTTDGEKILTSYGLAQGSETRRYRVKLPGFILNFANTGHIGVALWARGQERIAPQRWGDWSDKPLVITASDPRPPIMSPDIVDLASLPDASGQCHATLEWGKNQPSTNAVGYFIYESTETKLRQEAGLPAEAPSEQTLSQRLTVLKNIFKGGQVDTRPLFTRRNEKPITGKRADVTLPKGSTAIHLFVIVGVNAGQVESAWPTGPDADLAMYAVAAPRVMKPAPPVLEVRPILDTSVNPAVYRTEVRIAARPGPRVKKVELFRVRVDDAAKQINTMGPAVAAIESSGGPWVVSEMSDLYGPSIATIQGRDTPSGSWKRVWYRAAAWSAHDDLRGYLKGRSPESSAVWCVIPPSAPPNLSSVNVLWPGGDLGDVLLEWTSTAPKRRTPLGPHVLGIRAEVSGSPPLLQVTQPVDKLATAPPAPGESGVWITDMPGGASKYSAVLQRASVNDALQIAIRLTDPVGRTSERLLAIPAGPVLPAPDLSNLVVISSLNPPGKMLSFATAVPIDVETPAPYVIKVTANKPFPPGSFVAVELPVPDIPLDEPGNVPPGVDPLRIRRNAGNGPNKSYYAFCRVAVKSFVVRITAPDGRFVEKTHIVS